MAIVDSGRGGHVAVEDELFGASMTSPFKAYDVRGNLPTDINVPFAYRFGQAVAHLRSPTSVVVGHDMRQDSPALAAALSQGLLDTGVDVLPLGQCGTAEVYFQTARCGANAGLMVTASHNPADYNGIKMVPDDAAPAAKTGRPFGFHALPDNEGAPMDHISRTPNGGDLPHRTTCPMESH